MTIRDLLLPEWDHEIASTRKVLERCPQDRFSWQPHAKSMTLGQLANHTANLTNWGQVTLSQDEFNFVPGEYREDVAETSDQLLSKFDSNTKSFRELLGNTSDESMQTTWSLKASGQVMFAKPRIEVLRSMVLNHLVHHRGQLTVYLRLLDVPVPGVYGPSADEMGS
jgi:uncharacterized damage-inducible protein DinB